MSAIRNDKFRLVWLEALVAVADEENISAAARLLNWDQSTVSRYLENLKHWSGKELITINHIRDPEDAAVNVGLTEEGRALYGLASEVIDGLNSFRSEEARRDELLEEILKRVTRMRSDLNKGDPTARLLEPNIVAIERMVAQLDTEGSLHDLRLYRDSMRPFFSQYEQDQLMKRSKARAKRRSSRLDGSKVIDPSNIVISAELLNSGAVKATKPSKANPQGDKD